MSSREKKKDSSPSVPPDWLALRARWARLRGVADREVVPSKSFREAKPEAPPPIPTASEPPPPKKKRVPRKKAVAPAAAARPHPELPADWLALQSLWTRRRAEIERREARRWRRVVIDKDGERSVVSRAVGDPATAADAVRAWKKAVGWTRMDAQSVIVTAMRAAWPARLTAVMTVSGYRDGMLSVGMSNQALRAEVSAFQAETLTAQLRAALPAGYPLRRIRFVAAKK